MTPPCHSACSYLYKNTFIMSKIDLSKAFKHHYTAKNKPEIIEIEKAQFLSIEGKGDPSGKPYADKLQALYATAYTIKFMNKALDQDFVVAKLEGLWSFDEEKYKNIGISEAPKQIPRREWNYRMLIRMPDFVSQDQVDAAIKKVIETKQILLAADISIFEMHEGKCVQMMHSGPFVTEPETLMIMKEFMDDHGFQRNGLHHEIYLSDFRNTAPEKLKTILREPVK